jgi:hypothetical protein
MIGKSILPAFSLLVLLSACQAHASVCPAATGTPARIQVPPQELPTPTSAASSEPVELQVGGQTIPVDKVVAGPLCNDSWSGTLYVSCDVQVYTWEEQPLFLKGCSLQIAPGTVVYVAYHNDTAYYNGCSCHTGEIAQP